MPRHRVKKCPSALIVKIFFVVLCDKAIAYGLGKAYSANVTSLGQFCLILSVTAWTTENGK